MADNTIQEIKDRLDVAEVISGYIPAKKSGPNFKAVCPFHNEKTPSLMISPAKQIWHCFGCGEGGDVLKFLMRYQNVEFPEALQQAAELAGVQLPQYKPTDPKKKSLEEQLKRINRFAASVYQKTLKSSQGQIALSYLKNRGLTEKTIDQWEIGFAPDSYEFLSNSLKEKQVDQGLAIKAGVIGESENGRIYDRFRNRIMFPIHDLAGDVVGFSARVLPGASGDYGKYINSPETAIYNKSKIVFGLHLAKDEIRKADTAVVVEGQMDAIQAYQSGFTNTVATSGTALTELQLKAIKRFSQKLIFAFDGDEAGQAAALRATHTALAVGMQVKLAKYDTDKDPDEIIKTSPSIWKKILKDSFAGIDHYITVATQDYELGSLEQKQYIGNVVMPLLKYITNPLELDHYYKKISSDFAISETALQQLMEQGKTDPGGFQISTHEVLASEVNPEVTWEKEILGGIILLEEFKDFVLIEGLPEEYLSAEMKDYFAKALAGEFLQRQSDSVVQEATFMVESSLENLQDNELALVRELKKSFYLFKLSGLRKYLRELTIAIKKAELNKNTQAIEQLNVKFSQVSKLRFEIETKLQEA